MKTKQGKEIITKEKCLSDWNTPLFINYQFKDISSFIKKEFSTKDNDLLILIRLYQEICIMQKDDSQKSFNLFLSEDTNEKITTEEILYLVQNIKRLLYYFWDEIKQKNNNDENKNIYNSLINENPLLDFIKKNLEENNNDNKENEKNKMDIEEENIDINENKDNNADNIKIEIINIFNFILTTYTDSERPEEDIINFGQILIKYLILHLCKNENSEILKKLKKSISLLIGLYIKIFEEGKVIFHPIRIIFQQILNYSIKTILFNELRETNKAVSIYKILLNQNKKNLLVDFQNIILYYSKQLIYENVDSAQFRNPLELKNINGLNDIDKKIIFHPYLFKILTLLDEENANSFLGFYIRFFYVSEKNKLICCKDNIVKCLEYFIKINWISNESEVLIKIINNKDTEFDKIKKINEYIYLHLRTNKINQDNHLSDSDSKKKAYEKLQYLFKNIILENIKVLN